MYQYDMNQSNGSSVQTDIFPSFKKKRLYTKYPESYTTGIMVFCFVVGTDLGSAFEVEGDARTSISIFKEKIYKKNKNDFNNQKFDANKLILWKVDIPYDIENAKLKTLQSRSDMKEENNIIQEELGGKKLSPVDDIGDIFKDDSDDSKKIKNIRIIVQPPPPATTELGKKRPITEEEETTELKRSKWDKKKWDTNGAIPKVRRTGVYFVDTINEPLLNKIREGEFVALYGARATGKTTRVFRVMEQLEEEGYICIYISLEVININSEEAFWSSFGKSLFRTAPQHIKERIKSSSEFADLFSNSGWEQKVVLFIDEYDIMYKADDETRSSFLKVVRGIKATKEEYAIWSVNVVGPFSILHLSSEEVTTSPFNVKEPFQNPNFTQEQVQFLFNEYANEEGIIIDQEVVKDLYMRTNGHAGLVINCGKAIHEELKKTLNESPTLNISIWLDLITRNYLEGAILNYETFRKMVERLVKTELFRPAVDFLRSSFAGFLGPVQINDSEERRQANFLTAEGVLTVVDKDKYIYKMSSAFMDGLMRRRVISDIYKSCPESPIPTKRHNFLDILNILQIAIKFFDRGTISKAFDRSYKIADDLYVGGEKKSRVPRESVYDTELSRILVNWLVKKGGYEVTGQWHMVEKHDGEKDKHSYSDIVITTDHQKIILELIATGTKRELEEHFKRVLEYVDKLSANDIWIVHFTCEDSYATRKFHWPPDNSGINVMHIFHDRNLGLLINAKYADDDNVIKYIEDQAVSLQSS